MKKSFLKRSGFLSIVLIAAFFVLLNFQVLADFSYEHDPMLNPKAARDIVVNPDAIYGYSPNPDSTRLGDYAAYDWTDPELVEKGKADREAYLAQFQEIYDLIAQMKSEGKSLEEIARAASNLRNEIRLNSYKDDPEGLALVKKSNLETYGNENGPTPEYLYEKLGSWDEVLDGATKSNPGMDACLGLYDKYYDSYGLDILVPDDPTDPESDPVDDPDPTASGIPSQQPGKNPSSPKTGETADISLWIGLIVTAALITGAAAAAKTSRSSSK